MRSSFQDITYRLFGRWTVLQFACQDKYKRSYWLLECSCGTRLIRRSDTFTTGRSKSCGCYRREVLKAREPANKTHGESHKSQEWKIWVSMRQRCYNKNKDNYHYYGGRGIKVCTRWKTSYKKFLHDIGRKPNKDYTIERLDNNADYSPGNCIWATKKQQANNRRERRTAKPGGNFE